MAEQRKLQPGDPLSGNLTAGFLSDLVDLRNASKGRALSRDAIALGLTREPDLVRVKNQSGADLDRFGVVGLSDVIFGPGDNLAEFKNNFAWRGLSPAGHAGKFGICAEPIADGKVGLAVVSGLTVARVNLQSAGHRFADIDPVDATRLLSGASGAAQIIYLETQGDVGGPTLGDQWAIVRLSNLTSGVGGGGAGFVVLHACGGGQSVGSTPAPLSMSELDNFGGVVSFNGTEIEALRDAKLEVTAKATASVGTMVITHDLRIEIEKQAGGSGPWSAVACAWAAIAETALTKFSNQVTLTIPDIPIEVAEGDKLRVVISSPSGSAYATDAGGHYVTVHANLVCEETQRERLTGVSLGASGSPCDENESCLVFERERESQDEFGCEAIEALDPIVIPLPSTAAGESSGGAEDCCAGMKLAAPLVDGSGGAKCPPGTMPISTAKLADLLGFTGDDCAECGGGSAGSAADWVAGGELPEWATNGCLISCLDLAAESYVDICDPNGDGGGDFNPAFSQNDCEHCPPDETPETVRVTTTFPDTVCCDPADLDGPRDLSQEPNQFFCQWDLTLDAPCDTTGQRIIGINTQLQDLGGGMLRIRVTFSMVNWTTNCASDPPGGGATFDHDLPAAQFDCKGVYVLTLRGAPSEVYYKWSTAIVTINFGNA